MLLYCGYRTVLQSFHYQSDVKTVLFQWYNNRDELPHPPSTDGSDVVWLVMFPVSHGQGIIHFRPHFYQTRSAWSMDQGSNKNHSPVNNCAPTVTKFCVMWEGQTLPHDTTFGNCRGNIVDSRVFLSWSLIHGSSWSGLIKLGPGRGPWGCYMQRMPLAPFNDTYICVIMFQWVKVGYVGTCLGKINIGSSA